MRDGRFKFIRLFNLHAMPAAAQSKTRSAAFLATVFTLALLGAVCRVSPEAADAHYTFRVPSEGGIGKVYMGREIARVMGHEGAEWLERASRVDTELPDRVIAALQLDSASIVADIGAGTGFFTFRLARRVPEGKVYAVDIQPEMLQILRTRTDSLGFTNVETVLGSEQDPALPAEGVDMALIVDAYHEFSFPREMVQQIARALVPGGRLVLVEYRGEDETIGIKPLHRMTEAQVRHEMEAVGLRFRENLNVLPQQHLLVFEKGSVR